MRRGLLSIPRHHGIDTIDDGHHRMGGGRSRLRCAAAGQAEQAAAGANRGRVVDSRGLIRGNKGAGFEVATGRGLTC